MRLLVLSVTVPLIEPPTTCAHAVAGGSGTRSKKTERKGREEKELKKKDNPHRALWVSRGRLRGFREVPRANFAESAKRYGRFTCQRSDRGVATGATSVSDGGVIGDLHR